MPLCPECKDEAKTTSYVPERTRTEKFFDRIFGLEPDSEPFDKTCDECSRCKNLGSPE